MSEPTRPGWYWGRADIGIGEPGRWNMMRVTKGAEGLVVAMNGTHTYPVSRFEYWQWRGPIQPPSDEQEDSGD